MKKLILLLPALLLLFSSCHKDRALGWSGDVDELMKGLTYGEPPQSAYVAVAIGGQLTLKPDLGYGYCILPERSEIPVFNRWSVAGELGVFGRIDPATSYQDHDKCTLVPEADVITAMAVGTLHNENGDALYYYGDVICYEDGQYDGKYCISGGTGMFAEATGWISLDLVLSKDSSVWLAEVEGEILIPRG